MVYEYDGASISPRRVGAERGHSFVGQQLARTIVIVKALGGVGWGRRSPRSIVHCTGMEPT